jgi:hypothetical protein
MHVCVGFSNAQTRTNHGGNQVKIDATPTQSYRLITMVRSKQHGLSRLGRFGAVATGHVENTFFMPTHLQSHMGPYPRQSYTPYILQRTPEIRAASCIGRGPDTTPIREVSVQANQSNAKHKRADNQTAKCPRPIQCPDTDAF